MPPAPGLWIANSLPPEAYEHGLLLNSLTFAGLPIVTAPALLTAIAIKRGQRAVPTNDHEIEDFLYDALELLTGTNECRSALRGRTCDADRQRAARRLKRDVAKSRGRFQLSTMFRTT